MDLGENRDLEHPAASLLRRLKVLAIIALVIVLILLTMIGWRDYEARFEHFELRNLAQARTLAGDAARSLDHVDVIMARLANRLDRIMRVGDPQPSVLFEMLAYTATAYGPADAISLFSPDGMILADSEGRTGESAYMQAIRSALPLASVDAAQRLSIVRLPDDDRAGAVIAVRTVEAGYRGSTLYLAAELSAPTFEPFTGIGGAENLAEVALLTADGSIVTATTGFFDLHDGSAKRDLVVTLPLLAPDQGVGVAIAPPHWNRTAALVRVDGWPFVVMVASDVGVLFLDWAFIAGALCLAGLLITGGTVVAIKLGGRYLTRLADTENELRLHLVDLEISRLQLQEQSEQATLLAEELYLARDEAEAARSEAEIARYAADQANRAKSDFLARMSHELRTPLNAILGFAEIMKDGMERGGNVATWVQYSQDIYDSGSHLLSVINDILDLSKVEAGRFELAEEEVDLDYAARSVANLVRETAAKRRLGIVVSVPPGIPRLRSDQRVVRQMLLNLLSNSLKFTPSGGTVSLIVRENAGEIALVVEDTGIGIEEHNFAKILEPFGQVREACSDDLKGTGLGLPLVKSFIEQQGGRLELWSRVGEGTAVTLWFPAERVIDRTARPCPESDKAGCDAAGAVLQLC